jgi:hypothetical protein
MREIKFRAWDKEDTKKMIWTGIPLTDFNVLVKENLKEYAWLQYTGLKDKNGKEIYEEDILKTKDLYQKYFIVKYSIRSFELYDGRDGVLFDPPYSPRQLKECYDNLGLVLHDTKSSVWKSWKDEIARVIKPNGLCLSFGWSTNGLGKNRGFEIRRR